MNPDIHQQPAGISTDRIGGAHPQALSPELGRCGDHSWANGTRGNPGLVAHWH
jgi:hypothetical protein